MIEEFHPLNFYVKNHIGKEDWPKVCFKKQRTLWIDLLIKQNHVTTHKLILPQTK